MAVRHLTTFNRGFQQTTYFYGFLSLIFLLAISDIDCSSEMPKTFLYFGYGSNLLAKRIHLQNPSANRFAIGKLQGYALDFLHHSDTWGGPSATVVPRPESHVWGAVWEMLEEDKDSLDAQEGVNIGQYEPFEVVIESPTKGNLTCRSYKFCIQPDPLPPGQARPEERTPSRIYLEVILQGSVESGLPEEYFNELLKLPHNGSKGGPNVPIQLEFKYTKDLN